MKALMRLSPRKYDARLLDVPNPIRGPNQAIVKIRNAGICGYDIEVFRSNLNEDSYVQPPIILGHEGSGEIIDIEKNIFPFSLGDHVTFETTFSVCNKCDHCVNGNYNLCKNRRGLGSKENGCFAEYVKIPVKSLHKIPEGVDLLTASISEPLACAVHAVIEKGIVVKGETAMVIGPGPIGLLISWLLNYLGLDVILIGTKHSKHRLQIAKKWGVAQIYDNARLTEKKRYFGEKVDVLFECSGKYASYIQGLDLIRSGGRMIIVSEPGEEKSVTHSQEKILNKELLIVGSRSSNPSSWKMTMNILPHAKEFMRFMISDQFPISEWKKAFEIVKSKSCIKSVFTFD